MDPSLPTPDLLEGLSSQGLAHEKCSINTGGAKLLCKPGLSLSLNKDGGMKSHCPSYIPVPEQAVFAHCLEKLC